MKRWLVGLALACRLAAGLEAQPLTGGLLGRPAAAPGSTHTISTDTTAFTGSITAKNLTASGLATPGAITVTPVLTKVGSITTVAGASLVDGDYFTIKYDTGLTVPIEFDLSPGDGTTGGRVALLFTAGDSADTVRDNIILALNSAAPTKITASSGGAATVSIVLDTPGAAGDTNTENVTNAGFAVTGFVDPTAATTYTYKLVARLVDGSTTEAGAASTTAAGHATLSVANYNALSWSAVTGAASYDVYKTVGGTTGKILSASTALALNDTGLAGGGETAPTVDGTGVLHGDGLRIGTSATAGHVLTADANGYYTPQASGGGVPSGCVATSVPIFLGSPVALGCDAGLTYDAATDTLTTGRIIVGPGDWNVASIQVPGDPTTGLRFVGTTLKFMSGSVEYILLNSDVWVRAGVIRFGAGSGTTILSPGPTGVLRIGDAPWQVNGAAGALMGQEGNGTDKSGGDLTVGPGASTGAAHSGDYRVQGAYPSATGSTLNTPSDRQVIPSKWTALTESSATPFATLTYPASTVVSSDIYVTIHAADATNNQVMTYRVRVNSVRDATGNTQSTVGIVDDSATLPAAAGSGTLTSTFSVTEGAAAVTLNATAVSSLTQTTLRATFQGIANGAGLVVAPVGF